MKKKSHLILLFFLSTLLFPSFATSAEKSLNIIPLPTSFEWKEGSFAITPQTRIVLLFNGDKKAKQVTDRLNEILNPLLGKDLKKTSKNEGSNLIVIEQDAKIASDEAYTLDITPEKITIKAAAPQGAFYAIQSLRQIIPVEYFESPTAQSSVILPSIFIDDKPAFGYRGLLLDCCRHFFTVDEVKKAIDILALHKMNTLHWHLTEDQGWRIEIKKYPLLTEIGSVRKETVLGHNSGKFDGVSYGGYYTQKDVKEIVRYATERFITVIPEIEIPGHSVAAMAAYPELGCKGEAGNYEVFKEWGVTDQVACPGKENTFKFWEDVLTEVIALFPSEYIHIGGDECPKTEWKVCPLCQQRIKEEGLKDEHELQGYVTKRVEKFLNDHGRKIIGWDEILEGGVTPTATIMSWRGSSGGIQAAKMGNNVIMTPNSHCYIDYYQSKDTKNEPDAIGGYVSLEKAYSLNPYDQLTPDQYKYILGVQGNLWTEYIHTFSQVEYMILPRISAIAEIGWSYGHQNLADYQRRVKNLARFYDIYGYNYAKLIYSTPTK